MGWSAGNYSRLFSWVTDRAAGINPQASRFDSDANDMAAGISACLHAGGQNEASADISWGGNKITSLGTPTASTDAATRGYVDSLTPTGDIKFNFSSTAQTGWICYSTEDFTVTAANLPSIGNASSSATVRANADTSDLFVLLYTTYTTLTLQNGTTGATESRNGAGTSEAEALNDFAANRRLVLPDILGRTLGVAGTSGDTSNAPTTRATGDAVGEEAHQLAQGELPSYDLTISGGTIGGTSSGTFTTGPGNTGVTNGAAIVVSSGGGNVAHNTMQPTFFVHTHVKL